MLPPCLGTLSPISWSASSLLEPSLITRWLGQLAYLCMMAAAPREPSESRFPQDNPSNTHSAAMTRTAAGMIVRMGVSKRCCNRRAMLQRSACIEDRDYVRPRPEPIVRQAVRWCCQRGSNSRPLPYQGSALPLSYGSPPTKRAAYCHSAAHCASLKSQLYSAASTFGSRGSLKEVHTSTSAAPKAWIWASEWRGPGVMRRRSVPRGTVG